MTAFDQDDPRLFRQLRDRIRADLARDRDRRPELPAALAARVLARRREPRPKPQPREEERA